jgi:hypothetical protein
MDIEVFGIKLSQFIKAFKNAYDLENGTYDYMSFLNDTDCASFCGLEKLYKNPNDVLNYFINPALKSIDVVGGKKKIMKGGAQQQYIFILILFLLAVSNVFAGPKYDDIVREFGSDVSSWPKEPGTEPVKPENRFTLLSLTIVGPSSQAQAKYNAALSKWNSDKNIWEKFLPMKKAREIEYDSEQEIEKSKIAVDQTKATAQLISEQTELQKTQIAETQAAAVYSAYGEIIVMAKDNADNLKDTAQVKQLVGFLQGVLVGSGAIIGLVFYFVTNWYNKANKAYRFNFINNMSNRFNRGRQNNYQPSYQFNQDYRDETNDVTEGINNLQIGDRQRYPSLGYPSLGYQVVRRGGKTKNFRKKRTTKRKH